MSLHSPGSSLWRCLRLFAPPHDEEVHVEKYNEQSSLLKWPTLHWFLVAFINRLAFSALLRNSHSVLLAMETPMSPHLNHHSERVTALTMRK